MIGNGKALISSTARRISSRQAAESSMRYSSGRTSRRAQTLGPAIGMFVSIILSPTRSDLALPRARGYSRSAVAVDRIDPANLFRPLGRLDVKIDDNRLVVAAHQHTFEGL